MEPSSVYYTTYKLRAISSTTYLRAISINLKAVTGQLWAILHNLSCGDSATCLSLHKCCILR